jgi:hypothetical protein
MFAARRILRLTLGLTLLVGLGLLAGGCSSSEDSKGFRLTEPRPLTSTAPTASSPEQVLRLLEWCYASRNTAYHRTLFTADYRFVFGTLDPDGNAYRTIPWTREDELAYFEHLVNGGDANQPAATSLSLLLDRNFRVTQDPQRPGSEHCLIRTSVTLRIVAGDTQREIQGFANFSLTRGDAAQVPLELGDRDGSLWYIERWEDDTLPPGTRSMPAGKMTWGSIKVIYR